jgi:hypothetical protein
MPNVANLVSLSEINANTKFVVSHTANGTVNTYNVNTQVLFACNAVAKPLNHRSNTPANSTAASVVFGETWTDGDYLYVATSNTTVKRVALSSF